MTTRPRVFIVGAGFAGFHCTAGSQHVVAPGPAAHAAGSVLVHRHRPGRPGVRGAGGHRHAGRGAAWPRDEDPGAGDSPARPRLAELELGNAVGDEARRAAHCTFVVAADWLMHSVLGDDFTRLGLPDPMPDTLAGQEAAGQYLSSDDARQTTARILARDQGGWLT